ncbi:cyclin-dependent kinase 5 activator 2b [Denticeps clupeoides]|uniref:cyclin-dependent kinase 5 activator 2b n=1 Tax=Denticeps clupeoides TaxID=299321 RepID=UPI0010A4445E|nr:cyclin-dependent kinase 5 activator 1-like [Denticeps clupeoides]
MGTVLSISPTSRKGTIVVDGPVEKVLKKPSILETAISLKRLVTVSARKKSAKKVNPNPNPNPAPTQNGENLKKPQEQNASLAVPVPAAPTRDSPRVVAVQKQASTVSLASPRRVLVQASTGELLRCLGEFVCRRCYRLKELSPNEVVVWFRNVDRTLLLQGWQDQGFITPASLVFVYLLCRDAVTDAVGDRCELHGVFLTCLYLAYSYMGNEISYPLKPFIVEGNKETFWELSLGVIDRLSGQMMQINMDPHFFTEVFQELKGEGEGEGRGPEVDR